MKSAALAAGTRYWERGLSRPPLLRRKVALRPDFSPTPSVGEAFSGELPQYFKEISAMTGVGLWYFWRKCFENKTVF
jgi:hypothetical protein